MDTPTDIDGLWSGYYVLHGKRYPITARFAQSGGNLRGAMTDTVLHFETGLDEVQKQEGWSDEVVAELVRLLHEQIPEADGGPIVSIAELPATAALSGFAQGSVVRFRKTYQDPVWSGWRVGDYLVGEDVLDHSVEYEGELSGDGRRITGRWWLEPNPTTGAEGMEDRFELRRER